MLTVEPTSELIAEWKRIFEAHHPAMKPNRKTGAEVDQYFRDKYAHRIYLWMPEKQYNKGTEYKSIPQISHLQCTDNNEQLLFGKG